MEELRALEMVSTDMKRLGDGQVNAEAVGL